MNTFKKSLKAVYANRRLIGEAVIMTGMIYTYMVYNNLSPFLNKE
jgi:hypothetical protein